jgi:hypothetical protein
MEDEKLELIQQYQEEVLRQRSRVLKIFIPDKPAAEPFEAQINFLRDGNLSKIARCGNRASKTFTCMRDLAWKITRTHWYRQEHNVLNLKNKRWKEDLDSPEYEMKYLATKPKTHWIVGPTYDFVNQTMWGMYLEKMIPKWFIVDIKKTNQGNIDSVYFKNGDVLKCKTYAQQDTTKMGFVVDNVYIDEMPPDVMTITELVVRTFDCDGQITLGFTSLVQNDDIRAYVDKSCDEGTMSLHQWSIYDNPWYAENPDRIKRVLAEYKNMSEEERNARLYGHWYYDKPDKAVFEGINPEIVDDFPIPSHWRQARFTDPASHVTGHAIFAEDPDTGIWYITHGVEITWGTIAKAEDILGVIESMKPRPSFKYLLSVYDNAEAWFGAYGAKYGYRACILKNREAAVMQTRNAVGNGRVKFFRSGANDALKQFQNYRYKPDGSGNVIKKKDHILDCIMYFCREIPDPLPQAESQPTEREDMVAKHLEKLQNRHKTKKYPRFQMAVPRVSFAIRSRGLR